MNLRAIYHFLIRLHPERFRHQFEDQLLSTFDDHSGSRSALLLLLDAFVSVIRQWLLRPENFRPVRVAAGAAALQELDRRSRDLQKRAWRLNFSWIASLLFVYLLTAHGGAAKPIDYGVFGVFMIVLWFLYRSFVKGADVGQISILHPQRAELQRQRGRLLKWARGWAPPLVVLLGFNRFLAFLGWMVGKPPKPWDATPSQIWIDFAAISIWTLFFFIVVRRVNVQARQTVELEIQMLDASERSAG